MNNIWYILPMALITFTVRYAFFSDLLKFQINGRLKRFLSFTGPCVLSAMTAPIVLTPMEVPVFQNPYIIGALTTVILSFIIRNTLIIVLSGMSGFFIMGFIF